MTILDTNVVSELMKPEPASRVFRWVSGQARGALFTTALTEAEILFGIALLPKGNRRDRLARSAGEMFAEDFAGRVLPFDSGAALQFARIAAERRKAGRPISQIDAQIAAIARSRGAALATRNTPDFSGCKVALIDPWDDRPGGS